MNYPVLQWIRLSWNSNSIYFNLSMLHSVKDYIYSTVCSYNILSIIFKKYKKGYFRCISLKCMKKSTSNILYIFELY